jgi:hypothetical protein
LTLPLQPLLPLTELVLLRGERGEIVFFGLGPGLMQAWDHLRMLQELAECLPYDGIEPISPDTA